MTSSLTSQTSDLAIVHLTKVSTKSGEVQLLATGQSGIVIFTSGSTGRPKAALHSSERFLRKFNKPGRQLRTLAFLMFDHVAGMDTLFYTLANGGALILSYRRDPQSILDLIESKQVEVLPTSPGFLRMLCVTSKGDRKHDLSSLKVITYGSERMDAKTLDRVNRLFPNAQIIQKYGTTEVGSPQSISRGNDSLWLRFKGDRVETKVVNGVFWVRSQDAILGYLNAASPIDNEGWYCTGDLVDVDGDWILFRGRVSDIINVGGEKVSPAEVEQVILALDFVCDVAVAGESHTVMGEIVTARVALAPTMDPKDAISRIRLHCQQRLLSYKRPVKIDISTTGLTNYRQKTQRKQPLD